MTNIRLGSSELASPAFESAYRYIGRRLQIEGLDDPGADVKTLVKKALSESPDNCLLIIDNADDIELFFDRKVRLSSYFPSSPRGSILFTTRRSYFAIKCYIPGKHIISERPMFSNEALELFLKALDDKQDDIESIMKILNLLKYLPLAVKQASAYVAMTRLSVKKYLGYCQSSEEALLKLLTKDFEDTTRYEDSNSPVAMAWMISFKQISQGSPLAAGILQVMCFLAERDIPIDLVLHYSDPIETDEAIGLLLGYAFVTRQEGSNLLQIHRLVRLAMQNWPRQQGKRRRAFSDAVAQLTKWLSRTNPKGLKFAMIVISHVRTVLAGPEPIVWFLLGNLLANSTNCWKVLGYDHARYKFLEQRFKLLAQLLGLYHRKVQGACFNASEPQCDAYFQLRRRPRPAATSMRFITENEPLIGPFEEGGVFDDRGPLDANRSLPDKLTVVHFFCNSLYEGLKMEATALFDRSITLPEKEEYQEIIARQISCEALAICEPCLSAEHDDFRWLEESFKAQMSPVEEQMPEQFLQHILEVFKQWKDA
ncbi:uncharacterized protein N7498_004011 [Penicillium cinerascens]|uniref:NB-ARC domain-containing protein n=1 Tax=Penicillium cinerascens TaxID=70096 RepID=A0A9W9N342_9EURO|nr:uncharacterized protein N7498_004011 [Penicillium cinerascens]KAJ5212365.1 hypothetical protein N7498_004011 [Penicillium cinerascens]